MTSGFKTVVQITVLREPIPQPNQDLPPKQPNSAARPQFSSLPAVWTLRQAATMGEVEEEGFPAPLSPPCHLCHEEESYVGQDRMSLSCSAADSSSPEGSIDRPRKQPRRDSLNVEKVSIAVMNLQASLGIPIGTYSKKARVDEVVVKGFLDVAGLFRDSFEEWLSVKGRAMLCSAADAWETAAVEGRQRSSRSSKKGGYRLPVAAPSKQPVPDMAAQAIHEAFVGVPGHKVQNVRPSVQPCVASRRQVRLRVGDRRWIAGRPLRPAHHPGHPRAARCPLVQPGR